MSTVRNSAIAGVAAVLAVGGGFWTQSREANSPCSDDFYMSRVHDDIRDRFIKDSQVLSALEAASSDENTFVSASDKERYALAAGELRQAIAGADIVGRMKHPNDSDLKTCHLTLSLSDVFTDESIVEKSAPALLNGPDFHITTRFKVKFQDIAGYQLEENVEAGRDQWLVGRIDGGEVVDVQVARGRIVDSDIRGGTLIEGPIEAGQLVEAARIASVTRLDITIEEPEFLDIDYSVSAITQGEIPAGFYGDE